MVLPPFLTSTGLDFLGTSALSCASGGRRRLKRHGDIWRTMKEGVPNMASLDWSQCPAVESIPGKVSGAWVLKGTRMPVSAIFENIEAGANINDIMEWFEGLDREQVKAVIEFAARSLDRAPALTP